MRFLADGPSIPDELLIARDEGAVIFFCGAGVSRAYAGLPDFWELTQAVIKELGVDSLDEARRLVDLARRIELDEGIVGLISADRIFGLLERDFSEPDIEHAVANALRPPKAVDLTAHRLLLDLSRSPDSTVRLVTTNFDLLFEAADPSLKHWAPPNLPSPRYGDIEGIIHLHGVVNESYSGAAEKGFVLTSSNLGRAYLSDGWATEFIRAILDKYLIVFLGYTADDPPVQYLLEALNRGSGSRNDIYAFQSGPQDYAESRWRHKGVRPIAYDPADAHRALCTTLSAWSIRATNPDSWHEAVVDLARKGPSQVDPHERGQVAHLLSAVHGARRFASSGEPPPAEWLCVFDPRERYATPSDIGAFGQEKSHFDPFHYYGLDADSIPPAVDPDNRFASRNVPAGAWDCFSLTRMDRQDLQPRLLATFAGYRAGIAAGLHPRLTWLGDWLAKVADQPAALWWASAQVFLHPDVQNRIRYELSNNLKCSAEIRQAWLRLLNASKYEKNEIGHRQFQLMSLVKHDGWTSALLRELADSVRPHLEPQRRSGWRRKESGTSESQLSTTEIVSFKVEYPKFYGEVALPDEMVVEAIRLFRGNLECAISLETDIGGWGLGNIPPLEPDPNVQGASYARTHGISIPIFFYTHLFKQLVKYRPSAAAQEYLAWQMHEDVVFTRLKIWAGLQRDVASDDQFSQLLFDMTESVFWNPHHQRDLLLVVKERWRDLSPVAKTELERKLLKGPPHWSGDDEESSERRAHSTLNRIHWLKQQGYEFAFDFDVESPRLKSLASKWQPAYALDSAASIEGTVGWVRTETSYSELLDEPLSNVFEKARILSGRTASHLIENDPFAGLASHKPVRALSALTSESKRNNYPEWAWTTFLTSPGRKSDKPKFCALVAERLASLPETILPSLLHPATEWLLTVNENLSPSFPDQLDHVWNSLILALRYDADSAKSSVGRIKGERDWPTEALNAPAGRLANLLITDPSAKNLKGGQGLPSLWINRAEQLLSLSPDLRNHAITIFAHYVRWLFWVDPSWTNKNLLSVFESDGDEQNAIWAGFAWGLQQAPSNELYIRLKPHLLKRIRQSIRIADHVGEMLSVLLLIGWIRVEENTRARLVSSEEVREAVLIVGEDIRLHILWHLQQFLSGDEDPQG